MSTVLDRDSGSVIPVDHGRETRYGGSNAEALREHDTNLRWLSHLTPFWERLNFLFSKVNHRVHPDTVTIGMQLNNGLVTGANIRTMAMLRALAALLQDIHIRPWMTPEDDITYIRHTVNLHVDFIAKCRPLCIAMQNAVTWLNRQIEIAFKDTNVREVRATLVTAIEQYIQQRIIGAVCTIANLAAGRIAHGDKILIFSRSSTVREALVEAKKCGKEFSVIIIDSYTSREGHEMGKLLTAQHIDVVYTVFSGLNYHMMNATKVILGASAILANANVVNRCGAAAVALLAKTYAKPVLVLCETHKFTDRLVVDSCAYNEIGDPRTVIEHGSSIEPSYAANLMYDVTPARLIDYVISEHGSFPVTSITSAVAFSRHVNEASSSFSNC